MGVMMLAAIGVFPISVFLAGIVVQHFGPAVFFPLAGGLLTAAILFGLSQSSWRAFGSAAGTTAGSPAVGTQPEESEPTTAPAA
jgi:hypothetical protein